MAQCEQMCPGRRHKDFYANLCLFVDTQKKVSKSKVLLPAEGGLTNGEENWLST